MGKKAGTHGMDRHGQKVEGCGENKQKVCLAHVRYACGTGETEPEEEVVW